MILRYIFLFCVLILSVLGLAELMHIIKSALLVGKNRAKTYSLLFLSDENADRQLLYAAEQQLWLGKNYSDCIIAVNKGLKTESDAVCKEIAERYDLIYLKENELADIIDDLKLD